MDQIKIGKFIARVRKEQNMTQLNLADKLGVTDRAVSKWENGRGLPDISLIKPLCETLGISVNELLNGERMQSSESTIIVERTVMNVLNDREEEIKKRKRITNLCAVLTVIIIIFSAVFGIRLTTMVISTVRGEGNSISAAVATRKAQRVGKIIAEGDYEKASKSIGFEGKDRDTAEKEWCDRMQCLSEEIQIKDIEVSSIIADDYYLSGNSTMIVYDYKSGVKYLFDIPVTPQDGGIAFGSIHIDNTNIDLRRTQIIYMINDALVTWNPG